MDYIENIINKQRKFFTSQKTKNVNFRIESLKKLRDVIKLRENDICKALELDLGKSCTESYMAEIGMVLEDLRYVIKHTKKWSKKEYHIAPLAQFPSTSFRIAEPYGLTLIISPWNYPFLLTIQPLVGAISAGNCVIVKPSEYSVHTSKIMKDIIEEIFDNEYVAVILGEKEVAEELLENKFDYIFYTGSTRVGKIVMESAAKHLTPVTLELGGKSPCIVDKDSNVKLAAKRIIFGKLLNCGQTCVAPDYIFVQKEVKQEFINACKEYIEKFIGTNWNENKEYPKMINKRQFNRMVELIEKDDIVYGGNFDDKTLKIQPTLLDNKSFDSKAMQEEIFGPILPIIDYTDLEEPIKYINENHKPLALYIFTNNKKVQNRILKEVAFGGGCINDTIIHLASTKLGFGGVGYSGMGEYHGKFSFKTFSHYKSIVKKSTLIDLPMRYHPFKKINDRLIRIFMR